MRIANTVVRVALGFNILGFGLHGFLQFLAGMPMRVCRGPTSRSRATSVVDRARSPADSVATTYPSCELKYSVTDERNSRQLVQLLPFPLDPRLITPPGHIPGERVELRVKVAG